MPILNKHSLPFLRRLLKLKIDYLIGSSGAFETFAEVIELAKGNEFELKNNRNTGSTLMSLLLLPTGSSSRHMKKERIHPVLSLSV